MARKKLPPEVILFSSGGSLIFVFFERPIDCRPCFGENTWQPYLD